MSHDIMATLPSPRIFLTNLLNTLSSIPAPEAASSNDTNPLKNLTPRHRALLSTLHVLFPPPMLLQSLDLLDRNLVTRLIYTSESPASSQENVIYQVRSSQQPKSRFNQGISSTNTPIYTVRLDAWNCNCAAFTFSAFPGSSALFDPEITQTGEDGEAAWQFGGLSSDGKSSDESLPCCKHLLACLLAEKWNSVLGTYVKVRQVSRDEIAGVGGEA